MATLIHPGDGGPDRAVVAAWAAVPTTIVADLFRGAVLADPAIRPVRPLGEGPRLAGGAVTAWCEPKDYGPVHHAIAAARPGQVVVIAAEGRLDAAMIGELLGGAARRKGIAGVVVDGAVRDVATLASWPDFPVFCRGVVARGPSSMAHGAVNAPVLFGSVPVAPGDLVLGDDDGLVFVPAAELSTRLAAAQAMVAAERDWEARLAAGASTLDVFAVPPAQPA